MKISLFKQAQRLHEQVVLSNDPDDAFAQAKKIASDILAQKFSGPDFNYTLEPTEFGYALILSQAQSVEGGVQWVRSEFMRVVIDHVFTPAELQFLSELQLKAG